MDWVNTIVQGVLLGGLYALFAAGLSLIFGVMRLVNIAHGDLIVLAAYRRAGRRRRRSASIRSPSLVIVVPLMAVLGYALQRGLLNRTLGDDLLPPLLVTFGLSVIIQNGLLEIFTADSRRLQRRRRSRSRASSSPTASRSASCRCCMFAVAVARHRRPAVHVLPHRPRPRLPRHLRRSGDRAADGARQPPRLRLAMALSLAVVAIAGVFLAIRTNFDPSIGPARLIFGFEAVIIGGLGNLWGTLAGGIILGVAQAIGAQIDPGWQLLAGHLVFLLVLALRPEGLFPRMRRMSAPHSASSARRRIEPHRPASSLLVAARRARRRAVVGRPRRPAAARRDLSPIVALASLWNLLAGYAGLVSVGQQAYVGLRRLCAVRAGHASPASIRCSRSRSPACSARVVAMPVARADLPPARRLFRHRHLGRGGSVPAAGFAQVSALGGGSGISLPAGIVHRRSPQTAADARVR